MHDNDQVGSSRSGQQRLGVEFTGSGSEYFRIWLVNLFLTIITLSLYHPFAKARKLAYFHANTLVGGQPLGFHGNPWKMLRGHLLILLFALAYGLSSRYSTTTAALAIICFALLWPALWRASLQFRLGNTSWRGLRFGFDGSLGGAYLSMLPAVVPWVTMVAFALFAPQPDANGNTVAAPDPMLSVALAVVGLLFVVGMPLALAWIKRYQHGHYVHANQRSRLDVGGGAFYLYALKLLGVSLVLGVAGGALAAIAVAGGDGQFSAGPVLAMVAIYAAFFVVLLPFSQSRLQNLVWGHTRTQALQCHSRLMMRPLAWLTLKNLVLTILTIGLYWPFAAVATTRMRLQAISFDLDGDIAHWTAGNAADTQDATGDAAGDFFGIDLGL
jgi:uncharacterized membrane protein YjgN (DUF898 family)